MAAKDLDLWAEGEINVVARARLSADGRPQPVLLVSVSQLQPDASGMPEVRCGFSGLFFHRELGDLKDTVDAYAEAVPILRAATSRMFDEWGDFTVDDFGEGLWMSAGVLLLRRLITPVSGADVVGFLRQAIPVLRWFAGLILVDLDDLPNVEAPWLTDAGFRAFTERFFYLRNG